MKTQSLHVVKYRMEQDGATADGSAANFLQVDLLRDLSYQYGRNIRQGNVVKLVGFDVTPVAPESGQHEGVSMGVGTIEYMRPTRNRVKAWKAAFSTAMALRKISGLGSVQANRDSNYDFRVGLREAYGPVINNAAFVDEDEIYLYHSTDGQRSIFTDWNSKVSAQITGEPAHTAYDSFGLQHAIDDELVGDEDVNTEAVDPDTEGAIYYPKVAELSPESFGYTWSKGGRFGGAADDSPSWGASGHQWRAPAGTHIPIMCGLMGIGQRLAAHDDSAILGEGDLYVDFDFYISGWSGLAGKRRK